MNVTNPSLIRFTVFCKKIENTDYNIPHRF